MSKFLTTRSRLYRSRFLQLNTSMRLAAFFNVYTIGALLHRSKLRIFAKSVSNSRVRGATRDSGGAARSSWSGTPSSSTAPSRSSGSSARTGPSAPSSTSTHRYIEFLSRRAAAGRAELLAKKRAYWARAKSRKSFGKPPRLRHRPAHVGRVFRL